MTASVKTTNRMPTTNRLDALRLQLVATEMSLRVGRRIRQRREELGLRTQRELADLIPSATVIAADAENSDQNPAYDHVGSWKQWLMFKAAMLRWLDDQEAEWIEGLDQRAREQEHEA